MKLIDSIKGITTRNAVLLLAGAVFLQPFVSKGLDGFGRYDSEEEAFEACKAYVERNNEEISITQLPSSRYSPYPDTRNKDSLRCRGKSNHVAVRETTYGVTKGTSHEIQKGTSYETIKRFYF